MTLRKFVCYLFAAMICSTIAGCGRQPSGPVRYEVSGTVTYNGRPVPAGKVVFEPDRSAQRRGPRGIAIIENGRYKTLPDQGAISGLLVVQIFGFDGVCPKGWAGSAFGIPIFPLYQTKIDLPPEPSTQDFEVPAR